MKFQPDRSSAQTINGYGPGWIGVDADRITHSVIIGSDGLRQAWPCTRFEDLTPEHFAQLATLETELVIFGSGNRNRFPPPAWLAPLIARRLGLETMDTPAACRTYNILASEGRNVVAALILESCTRADGAERRLLCGPAPLGGHTVLHLACNRFQGKIGGCGRGHHQEQ